MRKEDLGTYQMLWDCPFCETKKLLGLTHRHCPNCGSPQDPAARYFPSEADKVAVADHVYTGTDKKCGNCDTPNGAAAHCCMNCGSPLDEAGQVARRTDRVGADGASLAAETARDAKADLSAQKAPKATAAPAGKKGSGCALKVFLGLALLAVGCAVVFFVFKREAALEVTGHTWSRSVEVEVFREVETSDWCDALPKGVTVLRRAEEKRSTRKVEDGEDCSVRQVDQGDGTFKETKECTPTYREEPVLDDKCYYNAEKWVKARTEKAEGADLNPRWPEVKLKKAGKCLGCEREGSRDETYVVRLKSPDDPNHTCTLAEGAWSKMAVGSKWTGEVAPVIGLSCDSLKPAK